MSFFTSLCRFWVAIGIFLLWGCTQPQIYPRSNVIVISVDTLRADHISALGRKNIDTPAIDSLIRDGVLFTHAFSQYPLTLPSHVTLLTGKLPPNHGVRDNLSYRLDPSVETLGVVLRREDYQTAAFVSAMVIGKRTGIANGFDHYDSDMGSREGVVMPDRPGSETVARASAWLDQNAEDGPFLLMLHLYEPHSPYEPPEPYSSSYDDPYDGEIAYVDHLVGSFLEKLKGMGLYDNAIVCFLSDHGEGLGDHGEDEHGVFLYRETLHVPLVIKLPQRQRAGEVVGEVCGLVDVKPTLESLLGVKPGNSDGVPLFSDNSKLAGRRIYSESYYPLNGFGCYPLRSVIQGKWHFIQYNHEELYDFEADPRERQNLLPGSAVPPGFREYLDLIGEGINTRGADSREDMELLASLGYTALTGTGKPAARRDPRALVKDLRDLKRAKLAIDGGREQEGVAIFTGLLEQNPCMHEARLRLAGVFSERGEEAVLEKLYEDGLACDPNHLPLLMLLVQLKLKLGKKEEAATLTQFVWETGPDYAKDEMSLYYLNAGEKERALNLARNVMSGYPAAPYSRFVLGKLNEEAGKLDRAIEGFQSAYSIFSESQNLQMRRLTLFRIAACYKAKRQPQPAVAALRQALEIMPDFLDARRELALLLGSLGRNREAIETLDGWVSEFPSRKNYLAAAQTMRKLGLARPADFYQEQADLYP